jgi:putative oxidoreductase
MLFDKNLNFYFSQTNQNESFMSAILSLGRWLYAIPFTLFGVLHFMNADAMGNMVPIPGGSIWIYLTGAALIAAALSLLIGKYDKLAATLLGVMLLIFVFALHLPGAMTGANEMAGAAFMYAKYQAVDRSVIG